MRCPFLWEHVALVVVCVFVGCSNASSDESGRGSEQPGDSQEPGATDAGDDLDDNTQDFVAACSVVSPVDGFIGDPEYNPAAGSVTWQEFSGALWLASIDPLTGDIAPSTGKGVLLANDVAPLNRTFNAAEWGYSMSGDVIVYTSIGTNQTPQISVLTENAGIWTKQKLPGTDNYYNPRASKTRTDEAPIVHFLDASSNIVWRDLTPSGVITAIPNSTDGHWVDGVQALTYIDRTSRQVRYYDIATATSTEITTDDGVKQRPYMWIAPDFNDKLVFFARVGNDLRVYVQTTGTSFEYLRTITSPSTDYPVIASPEPVVRDGVSYVSFMASTTVLETDNVPAEIWLVSVDATVGFSRRLSQDAVEVRTDPEPYDGTGPMFTYYTRVEANGEELTESSVLVSLRCAVGL
ncbi:MAG: hypothetical protein H7Z43_10870 [Clostridia bacterium]|nr:hypothetical protein [Deltaproteobacteria bacterium]